LIEYVGLWHWAFTMFVTVSHQSGGITVVSVAGEVDMATAPELERHVEHELRRAGCRQLVIDLRQTSFLALSGLECMLRARDIADHSGLELRLVVNTRPIAHPLELLHLRAKFKINETLAGACSNELP
jgi:anti-anti-sigma factor